MYRSRVIFVFIMIVGLWGGMVLRGAYLQLIPNAKFEKIKKRQFNRVVKLSSRRGDILDRNGQELAISVTAYSLFADPKIIKDPYAVAKKLAKFLKLPFKRVYKKISKKKTRFVWILRRLSREDYNVIRSWKIRGLGFKEEYKRVYPNRSLASSLLGYVGREQQGLGGLEKSLDETLSGDGKKVRVQRDARGRALVSDGTVFASTQEGSDVILTIDKDLQYWVETQLKKSVKEHQAESAWAVVLNPENSEILAMANYPHFDSNIALKVPGKRRRNKSLHDIFEPGSVMKVFTIAGAIDSGLVEPNTKFNTENGSFRIGKRVIKEADRKHAFKELTVSGILTHSSNVGTAKIALKMTDQKLYKTLDLFGFGKKSGADILGEARGLLSKPPWRDHLTANISFGHGIAVTSLQVANAYAAIANGGVLNKPYVVKEVRDVEQGQIVRTSAKKIHRVLSKESASLLKVMLASVVTKGGSGYQARIDGYPVAGKTGTAQKVNPHGRGYLPGHYIASFAGFVPVSNPKYVIYVAVDSPKAKGYYASTVAAPLFRDIAEFALRRDRSAPVYVTDKNVIRQKRDEYQHSTNDWVQVPIAELRKKTESLKTVPNLKGMTLRVVLQHLQGQSIQTKIVGKGQVFKTIPRAGQPLQKKLKIYLGSVANSSSL